MTTEDLSLWESIFQAIDQEVGSVELPGLMYWEEAGLDRPAQLTILDFRGKRKARRQLLDYFQSLQNRTTRLKGYSINRLRWKDNQAIYYTTIKQLVFIAPYPLLLENSIRQYASSSWWSNGTTLEGKAIKGNQFIVPAIHWKRALPEALLSKMAPTVQDSVWLGFNAGTDSLTSWTGAQLENKKRINSSSLQTGNEWLEVLPVFSRFIYRQQAPFRILSILEEQILENALVARSLKQPSTWVEVGWLKEGSNWEQVLNQQTTEKGNYLNFDIWELRKGTSKQFITALGDVVIASSQRNQIEVWINYFLAGNSLLQNTSFLEVYQSDLAGKNWYLWWEPEHRNTPQNGQLEGLIQGSKIVVAGLEGESEKMWMKLYGGPQTKAIKGSQLAWRSELSLGPLGQPYVFEINGTATILAQDKNFQLYAFEEDGSSKWRQDLDAPLQGPFETWLSGSGIAWANTAQTAYQLQVEEGQIEQRIPLPQPTTMPVCWAAFDQQLDKAIFSVGKDGLVYGQNELGMNIGAWNPLSVARLVNQAVLHFQHDYKDYLVLLDEQGNLYVCNRMGALHFPVQVNGVGMLAGPFYQIAGGYNRIVTIDSTGRAHITGLGGQRFRLEFPAIKENPKAVLFEDLLGDARKEFILLTAKELFVYTYEGKELKLAWQLRFPDRQKELFKVDWPGEKYPYLGTLNERAQKVYCIFPNGQLHPDFPLGGNAPFVSWGTTDDPSISVFFDNQLCTYTLSTVAKSN